MPNKNSRRLNWVLDDPDRDHWKISLVGGFITISVWDGRIRPIIWEYFDGFRCQISGEETIDLTFQGVDIEEAKRLAIDHLLKIIHQIGAELGLWSKKVNVRITGESVLFRGNIRLK